MGFLKNRAKMMKEAFKMGLNAKSRQTGKSLGRALSFIGEALQNPEKVIKITDHHIFDDKYGAINTHQMNSHLFKTVQYLIRELKLEGFVFHRVTNSILYSYDLDYDVSKIKWRKRDE